MTPQKKLYTLFEAPNRSRPSLILNTVIYILILVSIISLMLSSVAEFQEKYGDIFSLINNIVMPIFIIEYFLRLYASGYLDKYKGLRGKLKYMVTPYAIIDLLSILPYILINIGFNTSFIRSLRLLRIFRLLRVRKYTIFIQIMKKIMQNIKEELIVLLFFAFVMLIILSFVVYDIEHKAQPEVFTNIFQTLWWSVATLTTVGYGDMYPITALGKVVTAVITIMGIGFIAIPGGMFASQFISAIAENKKQKNIGDNCLQCGSDNIERYSNASLSCENETLKYDSVSICKNCNFTWLKRAAAKI